MLASPHRIATSPALSHTPRRPIVAIVVGTRPEAIKLAPVARALRADARIEARLFSTGQHADAVTAVLRAHGLNSLALEIRSGDGWRRDVARFQRALQWQLTRLRPDAVLVQGDTTSAYAGARAARRLGLPLGHVEAGLRSPDPADPFPEDLLRRLIARCARWHFAPTRAALQHLQREAAHGKVGGDLRWVGSSALDTLHHIAPLPPSSYSADLVVTLHRRENWQSAVPAIVDALRSVLQRRPALRAVWVGHPRAAWTERVRGALLDLPRVRMLPAMPQPQFLALAAAAGRVMSDSGGLQEELPVLGVANLVLRRCTERPEGVASGHARLFDPHAAGLSDAIEALLDAPRPPALPLGPDNPWGDGLAAHRIVDCLNEHFCTAEAAIAHGGR